ncbi:hypothetical protein GCM10011371_34700 [Novosphingobium marinum]|nr:hypothetical protein GCM10011371_34700 [Novosphingobium marinum]
MAPNRPFDRLQSKNTTGKIRRRTKIAGFQPRVGDILDMDCHAAPPNSGKVDSDPQMQWDDGDASN